MTRIRTTGAPVLMQRREDGTAKLLTFIPPENPEARRQQGDRASRC